MDTSRLKKLSDYSWEIERRGDMGVPGRIYASRGLLQKMDDKVVEQVSNVACLPGIQKASLAMPDAHWGYGFPIGGVGAFDPEEGGVICMGGIGFDISCGVRTMRTGMTREEMQPKLKEVVDHLFEKVPAGLGSKGKIHLDMKGIDDVLRGGARWAVEQGYGTEDDLEFVEENGRVDGADPSAVSDKAKSRQFKQVGTLGSGNHYLEVQYVEEVLDEVAARTLGIEKDSVLISLHCGSRALGHQIGTDYLKDLGIAAKKYNIPIKDRELACAPIDSPEGRRYFSAVNAGINCALANRQAIAHLVRQEFHRSSMKWYPRPRWRCSTTSATTPARWRFTKWRGRRRSSMSTGKGPPGPLVLEGRRYPGRTGRWASPFSSGVPWAPAPSSWWAPGRAWR
jgi:tRNA-splicing ligase RtcB